MALFNARSPAWELAKRLSSWSAEKKLLCMPIEFHCPRSLIEEDLCGTLSLRVERQIATHLQAPCKARLGSLPVWRGFGPANLRSHKAHARNQGPKENRSAQLDRFQMTTEPPLRST